MANRADKKKLDHMASGVGHPDEKNPEQQQTGLLTMLRERRDGYEADNNAEMVTYVDEIIRRIESIRRTAKRAEARRVQKRKSAKQARRITRSTR